MRQVVLVEEPVPHRVVDVVVDVRDAVDEPHDLALERLRLALAGVREDPVADLVREVERARDAERLLVVAEAPAEALLQRRVERVLARVPERRVAHVVPEPDRLGQILVQPQRPRDDARDRGRLERVGHARAVVVAVRVDEDLRLPLQPPERLRVDDAVAVALERRAHAALLLGKLASARLERADRERRQALLERADPLLESSMRRLDRVHDVRVEAWPESRSARAQVRDGRGDEERREREPERAVAAGLRARRRRPPRRRSTRTGALPSARR